MAEKGPPRLPNNSRRLGLFWGLLLIVTLGVIYLTLILPTYTRQAITPLQEGAVTPQDILAPRSLTYNSEILTQRQREAAAASVLPIYTAPDTSISRRQLEGLRAALVYITNVRADSFATSAQKEADLAALEDIQLDQGTAQAIIGLSDSRWQAVQQEAIAVLEQVMRSAIREDRLDDARRNVPTLISLALTDDQAGIVTELVRAFIVPNSFFGEDLTEAAREQARQSVAPVARTYVQGETIVQRGRVVTAADMEALAQFGLVYPLSNWQDFVSAAILAILVVVYILLYLNRDPALIQEPRALTIIFFLFVLFLLAGRLIQPAQTILLFLYPLSAYGLIIASLFGLQPALVLTLPLAILYAYNQPDALELTLYQLVGGYCGILALGNARRITSFFWAAIAIALAGMAILAVFNLPLSTLTAMGLATLMGVAIVNGIGSGSLTVLLQYFLAQLLGRTTPMQLVEISRPDHPLLQLILRQAPGTYQHSLQVSNLAEQAAERIGADPLLTRVGSIYHDAGKALNPYYFIENQLPGSPNPHDNLDPFASAGIIIQHVSDGLELARKYRLPRRIHDFIAEHHGTMATRYQYVRAVEAAGGDESLVDETRFRYPGPRPGSRETAILMLADGSEARVRAERPKDEAEMRALIKNVVENRLTIGELDNTDLTLRDLEEIIDSFTATLRGTYHPRLEYPQLQGKKLARYEPSPTVPSPSRTPSDVSMKVDP